MSSPGLLRGFSKRLVVPSVSLGVALLVAAAPDTPRAPDRPLESFALADQFGKTHEVHFPRTRPLLLLVGDRKGSEQIDAWVPVLKEHLGTRADILGLADVGGVPKFFRDRLTRAIQQKHQAPVLLDFERTVTHQLPCTKDTANLFVVDATGNLRASASGTATTNNLAKVIAAVNALAPTAANSEPPTSR